jgi:hypothetical protein
MSHSKDPAMPDPAPAEPAPAAIDVRDFRNALGTFATGVTIVTARGREGMFAGDRQECVQRGILLFDAAQEHFGQFHRRNLAFRQQRGELLNGGKCQGFFVLHGQKIFSSRRRFPKVPRLARFSEMRN